jgi:hypothetical protein
MLNFLVIYNRRTGNCTVREFGERHGREAIRERFAAEREHRGNSDIEVVVLVSSSQDELRKTHGRYFETPKEILERIGA